MLIIIIKCEKNDSQKLKKKYFFRNFVFKEIRRLSKNINILMR